MRSDIVTFQFKPEVSLEDAEATTRLAFIGAEAFHGGPVVKLYATYSVNRRSRTIVLRGEVGIVESIARMLIAFLAREYGESVFRIREAGASGGTGCEEVAHVAR